MTPLEQDIATALSRPEGIRLVRHWLAETRALEPAGHGDALSMAYAAGGRDAGLRLLALIRSAAPGRLAAVLSATEE
ncbi:MAG: hypothetical protein RLZZ501_843 [Pseudomonadota bacterium]|jgi:hypothetical protein